MGLDIVEFVMNVEEAIGVPIPDDVAGSMRTPRAFIDYVHNQLPKTDERHCLSQRAYYAVRRAMVHRIGISRSQLYRLFERAGGVAHYIQRQRLLRICSLLSDPENQRPIAALAADFCFEDASGFSRAFRQEFGCSPSDVRSAAKAGIPLVAKRKSEMEAE